jgi:hypothetical protein
MMETWGKIEASFAERGGAERLCWYITTDGSAGVTVSQVKDAETAAAWTLETSVALGEYLELDTRILLDLDDAFPAITKGVELKSS